MKFIYLFSLLTSFLFIILKQYLQYKPMFNHTCTLPSMHRGSSLILCLFTHEKGARGICPEPNVTSPEHKTI